MKPLESIIASPDDALAPAAAEARVSSSTPSRWVDYYELTKPRMNFLVVITTMVGFYMAAHTGIDWLLLLHTLLGTAATAAGASVLNQFIERDIDGLMPRTMDRPVPAGRVAPIEALIYGVSLGVAGTTYLFVTVNALTALLGAITLGTYVLLYTPMKRWTTLNTVIGAVPGAIPPMMGFTAAQGALSAEALAVFGILFFWQMPHFLAIAILYKDDYAKGGLKMLPVVDPELSVTSRQILLYGVALIPATLAPVQLGMAGAMYFTAAVLLGFAFLTFGVSCATTRTRSDARKLFFASIVYLPVLLAAMMLDKQ
jgi:protoheme IX farnesyltransferase